MDYFQDVVIEYLRADRAMFINAECCIQLNPGENPDKTGLHWYCDAVAVNLRSRNVFLCEVTYAKSLTALMHRLTGWSENWPQLKVALARDCALPTDWTVRPWIFIPQDLRQLLNQKLDKLPNLGIEDVNMPRPDITDLEKVLPWKYKSWNRNQDEDDS